MLEKNLEVLGLNKTEISVYLCLFLRKSMKAGQIIKETKLHRNLVYQALEHLVERGAVSKIIEGGVFAFEVTSPEHLLENIDKQRMVANDAIEELKKIRSDERRDIRVYDGLQAVMQARRQSLELARGETVTVLGASPSSSEPEFEREWRKYHKEREKRGIKLKILYERSVDLEQIAWRNSQPLTQARILPEGISTPIWFEAYGDIFSVGVPKGGPMMFSLRSKEVAEGFRNYFDFLWNQESFVLQGKTGVWELCKAVLNEGNDLYLIGANGAINSVDAKYYAQFTDERLQRGMRIHALAVEAVRGTPFSKLPLSDFLYMPPGFESPMVVWLFGNCVANVLWHDEPKIFLTRNEKVAECYRQHFNALKKLSHP